MMLNCEETKILLNAYIDKSLSVDDNVMVEAHVKECPICQHDLDSLIKTSQLIKRMERVQAPPGLAYQIKVKIEQEVKTSFWGTLAPKNMLTFAFARQVGIVFVLVMVLTYISLTLLIPKKPSAPTANVATKVEPQKPIVRVSDKEKVIEVSPRSTIEESRKVKLKEDLRSLGYMKTQPETGNKKNAEQQVSKEADQKKLLIAKLEEKNEAGYDLAEKSRLEALANEPKSTPAETARETTSTVKPLQKEVPAKTVMEEKAPATPAPQSPVSADKLKLNEENKPVVVANKKELPALRSVKRLDGESSAEQRRKGDSITIDACPLVVMAEAAPRKPSLQEAIKSGHEYATSEQTKSAPGAKDDAVRTESEKIPSGATAQGTTTADFDHMAKGNVIIPIRFLYIQERPRIVIAKMSFDNQFILTNVELSASLNEKQMDNAILESLKASNWQKLFTKCSFKPDTYEMQFLLTKEGLILDKITLLSNQ